MPTGILTTAVGTSTPILSRTRIGGMTATGSSPAILFFPHRLVGFLQVSLCANRPSFFPNFQYLLRVPDRVFVRARYIPMRFAEKILVYPYYEALFPKKLFSRSLTHRKLLSNARGRGVVIRQFAYLCRTVHLARYCAGWGATRCTLSLHVQ